MSLKELYLPCRPSFADSLPVRRDRRITPSHWRKRIIIDDTPRRRRRWTSLSPSRSVPHSARRMLMRKLGARDAVLASTESRPYGAVWHVIPCARVRASVTTFTQGIC
jgi:hypothetical protein